MVKQQQSAILMLCGGLLLMLGCGDPGGTESESISKTSQHTSNAPAAYPATYMEYSPLVRGPLAPIPGNVTISPEEQTDLLLQTALSNARRASTLATGADPATPAALAPWVFLWPEMNVGAPLPVLIDSSQEDWSVTWNPARPSLRIHRQGLSPDQHRNSAGPKITAVEELGSVVYAHGADDRSRFKRHTAVTSAGPQRLASEAARRLSLIRQVSSVLESYLHRSGSFLTSAEDLQTAGVTFWNLVPAADAASADFTLEWDGIQAYGLSVRLSASYKHEEVMYVESYGLDQKEQPHEPFIGGASAVTVASTRFVPRFLFDRHAGRTMTLIGAWNLVPAEQATLPWEAVTS